RGSPLLIGVRSKYELSAEHIPIQYNSAPYYFVLRDCAVTPVSTERQGAAEPVGLFKEGVQDKNSHNRPDKPDNSTAVNSAGDGKAVEYYFASDASAIIEHTNKVIYLEDDDIAAVVGGKLSLHRLNSLAGENPVRAIQTLQMELQEIMKGQRLIIGLIAVATWEFTWSRI
ncbi:unnamed protein product, partial [Oncorhynchus mykiss]